MLQPSGPCSQNRMDKQNLQSPKGAKPGEETQKNKTIDTNTRNGIVPMDTIK